MIAPHGDGLGGVFGIPPFAWRSSVRLVSGDSLAHSPASRAIRRLMRTECRAFTSGFPCNTTATHPAAPLGSRSGASRWEFSVGRQEGEGEELRDEIFTSNFQSPFRCGALKVAFKQKLVAHTREALKVGFKQKLVPRVTRVAHVPRRS